MRGLTSLERFSLYLGDWERNWQCTLFFFLQEHMSHLLTLDRLFISHYFNTREDTICGTTGSRMKDMRKVSISKIKLSEVTWPGPP